MKHDHVCIITSNAEKLMAWYQEKLGFEFIQTWSVDAMPGLQLYYIGRDGFKIEVVGDIPDTRDKGANPLESIMAGYNHFAVQVHDIETSLKELEEKDVQIAMPAMDVSQAGFKAAMILDIDGNLIELIETIK